MYRKNLTMSQAFYNTVNSFPERTAQVFNPDLYGGDNGGKFTWKEMAERVELIGCGLLSLGLAKGERVALMARNSPYWTHADVAVINCGAVLVTVYPTLSRQEVEYIVNDSESRYLFVGDENILNRILPGLFSMPTLQKIIMLQMNYKSSHPMVMSLGELVELGRKNFKAKKKEYDERWQNNKMEDWATILYTSGTTGQGKGAILSHWSFSSRMDGTYDYFNKSGHPLDENDTVLSFLPLSHIFDRGCSQWTAIWVGATIAYADSPATLLEDMKKYNPTWFSCVPRLYERIYMQFQQQLAASPVKKKLFDWALKVGEEALKYRMDEYGRYNMTWEFDLKSRLPFGLRIKYSIADKLFAKVRALFGNRMRFAFSASAGIAPDLLKFFYTVGVPVMEGYGLTETTSAVAYNPMRAAKPGTVGPEACGSRIRLAPDGEIEVSGAGVFVGYLNKPEETKEAFTEDGWFKTGDIGVIDENGYYRIVDRKKSIICLAIGKNVAPLKIEGLFATSIAVEQVFIVGDERNYITALIVPNFAYFMELFDREGISYDKEKVVFSEINGAQICVEVGEDFINQPLLQDMIDKTVKQVNSQLEEFEVIKQYTIIRRRFTEENGELTPTQKTKKRVILQHYADVIENMYKQKK
ncbi:long-chain acyl-CoA synthetase [Thermosyntropha lipolytica DSM 11003]|uniref:Long-chain acyl-CoA synthetase n=1 Tax=Thermosyntropha lipolytica DSM 11003 TaxID=1123382 RepID=A0A1M5J869_9FIRM|nr:long-chain fatty acid--CoA ligase [Thermosyntropha lipolytica]SHG36499.1 long-chain acyl-CoA synthetase [Thermosyntropha lipolytica DSM 11003]